MTVFIGGALFSRLTAQPLQYESTEVYLGNTARAWTATGLLTPAEWLTLLSVYDTWRTAKIAESSPLTTGLVGATVSFSGTGAGGQVWNSIPCWFLENPTGEQVGKYINVSVRVVEAEKYLQILQKQEENTTEEDSPTFGTFTLGSTVLTLKKPPDAYTFTPVLEQTAGGHHYVTGPLSATKILNIEGETNSTGWDDVRGWYETAVQATPSANTYYPLTPPEVSAAYKMVGGVKTLVYTIIITLALVK